MGAAIFVDKQISVTTDDDQPKRAAPTAVNIKPGGSVFRKLLKRCDGPLLRPLGATVQNGISTPMASMT